MPYPPITFLSLRTVPVVSALMKRKASLIYIFVHQSDNPDFVRYRRVVGSPQKDLPHNVGPLSASEGVLPFFDDEPDSKVTSSQGGRDLTCRRTLKICPRRRSLGLEGLDWCRSRRSQTSSLHSKTPLGSRSSCTSPLPGESLQNNLLKLD